MPEQSITSRTSLDYLALASAVAQDVATTHVRGALLDAVKSLDSLGGTKIEGAGQDAPVKTGFRVFRRKAGRAAGCPMRYGKPPSRARPPSPSSSSKSSGDAVPSTVRRAASVLARSERGVTRK